MQGWYDGKGLIYYRPINKSALCRSTSPAFSFVFNGVACWPGPLPVFFILETLRSEDGDGRDNVAEKVNSCSFNLHRDYSKSVTSSNVGEPS